MNFPGEYHRGILRTFCPSRVAELRSKGKNPRNYTGKAPKNRKTKNSLIFCGGLISGYLKYKEQFYFLVN
jgi:hypothetical protein